MKHTTIHLVTKITETLEAVFHNTAAAEHAAWWLLQKLTEMPYSTVLLTKEITLTAEQEKTLDQWLYEMVHDHKPLAYILGTVPFLDLTLVVEPPILIPRPETEEWCNTLIKQLQTTRITNILDLCTGSGCIVLAVAQAFPQAHVTAVDIVPHALELTQKNAQRNGIANITYVLSDLYTNVTAQKYDLIVSNPPYITEVEWNSVELSVKNWEDPGALLAADDGLALIKRIITQAPPFLNANGQLWIEIGYQQGPAVKELFITHGFSKVTVLKDYNGNDRVVHGIAHEKPFDKLRVSGSSGIL